MLSDVRRALDAGEIVVHYQPIVRVADRTVRGAEALVRWQHPELGLLGPGTFIPTVEQTGLIGPLTGHVLEQAIAQCAAWRRSGRELSVAVNLSVRNLLDRNLPGRIEAMLTAHQLDPTALQLEITESMIMSDPDRVVATVARLSALGPRISVDDFGTGYSSLAILRRFPIDELKIDPLDRLASLGCDLAQGYHLSAPLAPDAFAAWLVDGEAMAKAARAWRSIHVMPDSSAAVSTSRELDRQLDQHRAALTGYCYRMLGSPFEAEDAVQETMIRAWRGLDRFEGRAALRSWLYRIATNVCLDMLNGRSRRAVPMDFGPASAPVAECLNIPAEVTWLQPVPDRMLAPEGDPAEVAESRETIRLAFVAALQHLPARQRAALILCEVLRWQASEVAELLDTSVASVNSALQRARATLSTSAPAEGTSPAALSKDDRQLLERYMHAFERYDMETLTSLIREDATQSMPPYDMWLSGRDDVFAWWVGPGAACRGSRMLPTLSANGSPAFGQYKPSPEGGYEPWALQVLELADGQIVDIVFFLDTEPLFPLFGLPPRLDASGQPAG